MDMHYRRTADARTTHERLAQDHNLIVGDYDGNVRPVTHDGELVATITSVRNPRNIYADTEFRVRPEGVPLYVGSVTVDVYTVADAVVHVLGRRADHLAAEAAAEAA